MTGFDLWLNLRPHELGRIIQQVLQDLRQVLAIMLGSVDKALSAGLLPFRIGDATKLIAASLALPAAWKLVK